MAQSESLRLAFLDVEGNRPKEHLDITLRHTVLDRVYERRNHPASRGIRLNDIDTAQGGRYMLRVYPQLYRSVFRLIQVSAGQKASTEAFTLPIRPDRVASVSFPEFIDLNADLRKVLLNSEVEGTIKKGEELYQSLDNISRAGLLNLYAKMKATVLGSGKDAFSYVAGFTRIRGDRFFGKIEKEFRDHVKNSVISGLFHEADDSQHTPPEDFQRAGSFKSFDLYGNLQLTFFCRPLDLAFRVDADIDDAQGIGHLFQVTEHWLTGSKTHPYDIHQILIHHQHIHPGYELHV